MPFILGINLQAGRLFDNGIFTIYNGWVRLKLIKTLVEASDVTSFLFEPPPDFTWQAGQYLRYQIDDPHPDSRGNSRFFTIASAPFEKVVRLTTRFVLQDRSGQAQRGSQFKENLKKLTIGSEVEAAGPLGRFTVDDSSRSYVFIAGGIGITPFRSILLDLDQRGLPINITLLYSNRNSQVVFREEFEKSALKIPSFKVYYFIEPNRLTADTFRGSLPGLTDHDYFYISGPEPMVKAFEALLPTVGVAKEKIKHDYFPGYSEI